MRALLTAIAIAAALLATGCGGDTTTSTSTTAPPGATGAQGHAGHDVPASEQPGGPEPGEPDYTALGSWWQELSQAKRVDSAAKFIADNPSECPGIDPEDLERQTYIAFGYDYPQNVHVADVMRDTCELLLH